MAMSKPTRKVTPLTFGFGFFIFLILSYFAVNVPDIFGDFGMFFVILPFLFAVTFFRVLSKT